VAIAFAVNSRLYDDKMKGEEAPWDEVVKPLKDVLGAEEDPAWFRAWTFNAEFDRGS